MKVENITSRTVNTKFGPKPSYTITCDGGTYGFGFKKPTFNIGDEINFDFENTKYGNQVLHETLVLVSSSGGTSAPTGTPPARGGYASSRPSGMASRPFPIPDTHGDRAIVRQNALGHATKLVVDAGMFVHATTEENRPNQAMEVAKTVIKVASLFEAYACGDLDKEKEA
jgi:hypothetical protein